MVANRVCLVLLGVAACALISYPLLIPTSSGLVSTMPDTTIPADISGITVTVFELSEEVSQHNFTLSQLMTTGGTFRTPALYNETYIVTSDGEDITIGCYHLPPFNRTGVATGNNIVAVRMNGVSGYPSGLWASEVVSYSVGHGGIAESRFNALGLADQLGPYGDYLCTFMGDYASELVLGFDGTPVDVIQGRMDFDPNTINLNSNGKWVTCYIELPEGYDVSDILIPELMLNDAVYADVSHASAIGDADEDGVPDLAAKFDRESAKALFLVGGDQVVWVSGELAGGTLFSASDLVAVMGGPSKG